MRVLLTGGTGYIGVKLTEILLKEHNEIFMVVRNPEKIADSVKDKIEFASVDSSTLIDKIKNFRPEIYINLAGFYTSKDDIENIEKLWEANTVFPSKILKIFIEAGGTMHINTASYQQQKNGIEYSPMNFYSATKEAYEKVIKLYCDDKKIKSYTLTLFDTYGSDDSRNKVFNYVRKTEDGGEIGMSPGAQKLYFVYISDVVLAYIYAMNSLVGEEVGTNRKFSVRSETPISLKEFISSYCSKVTRKINVVWGARDYLNNEIMDPTGYGEILTGWAPKVSYEEGIKLCAEEDNK